MTDDITKDLNNQSASDKLDLLVNLVTDMRERQAAFEGQLDALRELVYTRLSDTRPIWTAVQTQLETQQQQLAAINDHLDQHDASFARLESLLEVLNQDHFNLKGRQLQFEKRLALFESDRAAA